MYYISQSSRLFWVAVKQGKSQVREVLLSRNKLLSWNSTRLAKPNKTKIFDFRTKLYMPLGNVRVAQLEGNATSCHASKELTWGAMNQKILCISDLNCSSQKSALCKKSCLHRFKLHLVAENLPGFRIVSEVRDESRKSHSQSMT